MLQLLRHNFDICKKGLGKSTINLSHDCRSCNPDQNLSRILSTSANHKMTMFPLNTFAYTLTIQGWQDVRNARKRNKTLRDWNHLLIKDSLCLTGIFYLITEILRWVRQIEYTKKEIFAKIFFSHMIMVFAKTMWNTARPWRNNIILNSVRQHNHFITQSTYIGYMFRLQISHLQACFCHLNQKMLCILWDPIEISSGNVNRL